VRIGVIAEREARSAPQLQDFDIFGVLLQFLGVNKAIHLRHMRILERFEDAAAHIQTRHTRRQ